MQTWAAGGCQTLSAWENIHPLTASTTILEAPMPKHGIREKQKCPCGGTIQMKTTFQGKIRHYAECDRCKRTARKPSDFWGMERE